MQLCQTFQTEIALEINMHIKLHVYVCVSMTLCSSPQVFIPSHVFYKRLSPTATDSLLTRVVWKMKIWGNIFFVLIPWYQDAYDNYHKPWCFSKYIFDFKGGCRFFKCIFAKIGAFLKKMVDGIFQRRRLFFACSSAMPVAGFYVR